MIKAGSSKILKVTLPCFILRRQALSTLPLRGCLSHNEFGFDLGLSSCEFSACLEKSFYEVYDQQYGEVKMFI